MNVMGGMARDQVVEQVMGEVDGSRLSCDSDETMRELVLEVILALDRAGVRWPVHGGTSRPASHGKCNTVHVPN